MKGILGLVGLLLALAVVGVVVKKQLASSRQGVPALQTTVPAATEATGGGQAQSQPLPQQYKQALEVTVPAPRPLPDDSK